MIGRNKGEGLDKLKRLVCADIIEDAKGFKRYVCYDRELNLYRYLPRNNFIKAIEKNEVEDAYLQKLRAGNVRINAKTHIEYEINIQKPADYMILKPIDDSNSLFKLVDTRYNNDENITIPKCVVEVRPGALANCVGAKYIHVDNLQSRDISLPEMCKGMKSKEIWVVFQHPERVIDLSGLFKDCKNLVKAGVTQLSILNTKQLREFFYGCEKLRQFNFGDNKRLQKSVRTAITQLEYAFYDCRYLQDISPLMSLNLQKNKSLKYTFALCHNLKHINLDCFSQDILEDMTGCFCKCGQLETVGFVGKDKAFKVQNNIPRDRMFEDCVSLDREQRDATKRNLGI